MIGVKSVFRRKEASAFGGSFAQQGGLIAWQFLSIYISRATSYSIITIFFYQGGP